MQNLIRKPHRHRRCDELVYYGDDGKGLRPAVNETPEEKAKRLGVPLIPKREPYPKPFNGIFGELLSIIRFAAKNRIKIEGLMVKALEYCDPKPPFSG